MESAATWDIFCKVIDNHGDIGVCWRLAADLASRGQSVRLWVDEPGALRWMAPGALEGRWARIRVPPWETMHNDALLASLEQAGVWIEGFGCEIPEELVKLRFDPSGAHLGSTLEAPVWINLEYLSAENFAERSHGLPSPVMRGPAAGHTKFFFYPGFTVRAGGLLREPDLATRQARFDRASWLAAQGIAWRGERLVSLFCYEPAALAQLLERLRHDLGPTLLLVTHGRAAAAARQALDAHARADRTTGAGPEGQLSIRFLPPLTQTDFDHLLWSCALNFVRGEDSLVRAIWAGNPFVWQIYPQHDDAHHAKLQAFLNAVDAPHSWLDFHLVWNGIADRPLPPLDTGPWIAAVRKTRDSLAGRGDLTSKLLAFVGAARRRPHCGAEKR